MIPTLSYLVKAYSESFEEVDAGVIEALRASGASWWQVVFSAVVPEKITEILFYYNIHEVGVIVYLCLAVAIVLEVLSIRLRRHYIVHS